MYVAPIYNDDAFFKAIATNAVLPIAVCPVPGTVVACPGEGTIQLNIEGEVTLHWRQAGIAHTVTWVCWHSKGPIDGKDDEDDRGRQHGHEIEFICDWRLLAFQIEKHPFLLVSTSFNTN